MIILLASQLLFLRPSPWLPRRIRNVSFKRRTLHRALRCGRPWARRLDWLIRPRLTFLVQPPLVSVIALICIVQALLFFPLAFIPGSEKALAVPVFLFSLALTARDGLLVLLGVAATGGTVWLLVHFWPRIVEAGAWLVAAIFG
jgi:hypothetical protein